MPDAYKANRARWRETLPDGWEMRLWDTESASRQWPEFAKIEAKCSHHAMRADIVLARAQRDFGGLAFGTDVIPHNVPNLIRFLECNDTLVVTNIKAKSCSNGLSWFAEPAHPFICWVCRHQLRDEKLLSNKDVWRVTGPGAWWDVTAKYGGELCMVTDARAYTKVGAPFDPAKPQWVDPGMAGSWH